MTRNTKLENKIKMKTRIAFGAPPFRKCFKTKIGDLYRNAHQTRVQAAETRSPKRLKVVPRMTRAVVGGAPPISRPGAGNCRERLCRCACYDRGSTFRVEWFLSEGALLTQNRRKYAISRMSFVVRLGHGIVYPVTAFCFLQIVFFFAGLELPNKWRNLRRTSAAPLPWHAS